MISHKILALLFGLLFITSLTYAHADDYNCDHDDHNHEIGSLDIEEDMSVLSAGRVLQGAEYPNMRIQANFENLDSAPGTFASYVADELVPPVLDFLSAALRIKYPVVGPLKVSKRSVCGVDTPAELISGVDADYYIIFDHRSEDSSTVASSKACETASGTRRPIIAYCNINRNMLQETRGDVLLHEKNMYLIIHEMMHTLGVSKNHYEDYLDEFGQTRRNHIKTKTYGGKKQTIIDIPFLTQKLRNYYGCPTVEGIIMENDGGSGTALSHMERKFFVYETMASGGIFGRRVSEFSLGLLEGSGWYVPNYDYAEPYFFGQGQGCEFIEQKCSSSRAVFEEFCTGSQRGCAPHGRSGGKCSSDSKSNGCKYVDPDTDFDCENPDAIDNARLPELEAYGREENSKCFTGTLNTRKSSNGATSFCFKYTCVGTGADTVVEVQVGRNKLVCTEKGPRAIDGYYGDVDCPDPLAFCNTVGKQYCPRNCMGRGTCKNNKCECFDGYTGVDCGLFV